MNLLCYRVVIYDESLVLYERACTACSTALEKKKIAVPARCASVVLKQLYRKSRTSLLFSPKMPDGSISMHRGKRTS